MRILIIILFSALSVFGQYGNNTGYSGNTSPIKSGVAGFYLKDTTANFLLGTADGGDSALTGMMYMGSSGNLRLGGLSGLFWGNSSKRLGIGTTYPTKSLHVIGDIVYKVGGADWGITDSSIQITHSSGAPQIKFYGTDGDETNISLNTSDQMTFNNAAGGYFFDNSIDFSTDNVTIGMDAPNNISAIGFNANSAGALLTFKARPNIGGAGSATQAFSFQNSTYTAGAGANNFEFLNGAYTANFSGAQTGILSGIKVNATETALNGITHNLIDLQVNAGSIFKVTNTGIMTLDSLLTFSTKSKIDSATIISIPTGVAGWGTAMIGDNQEYAQFRFTSTGVVTLVTNSTNVSTTPFNANTFNIYDAGTGIAIQNYLSAGQLTVGLKIEYYTP